MTAEENYYYSKLSNEQRLLDYQQESIMANLIDTEFLCIVRNLGAKISKDGNQWCCLYGDNIQVGICGFGDTPREAVKEFNNAFNKG